MGLYPIATFAEGSIRNMSDVWGQVWPQVFKSGERVVIRVENLPDSARSINAQLSLMDSVATQFLASAPLEDVGNGMAHGELRFPEISRESAIYLDSVVVDGSIIKLPKVSFSICNPDGPLRRDDHNVISRVEKIRKSQEARYSVAVGDANAPGAKEFRIAFLVEDLLITTPLRLPGIQIFGLEERPKGRDAAELTRFLVAKLGWAAQVAEANWSQNFAQDHPVSAIVCEQVYALNLESAIDIAVADRDKFLSVLALNRGSRGRPIVTIGETLAPDSTVDVKFRFEHPTYSGNLAGGLIAGEGQESILRQDYSLGKDPLLKLCLDLYSEALPERSTDAKYFRIWSALETLAISRVAEGQRVQLLDGAYWPDGLTTNQAAGRVYRLIADSLFLGSNRIDEKSAISPASSLYDAVRCWYARRNATAHYGKFVVGDQKQISRPWYADALKTVGANDMGGGWLKALQHLCALVLGRELARLSQDMN